MISQRLLQISDLGIAFEAAGERQTVVDGTSLNISRNKTVALVGESGCGKTLTALAVLRLLPTRARVFSGTILLEDRGGAMNGPDRVSQGSKASVGRQGPETNRRGGFDAAQDHRVDLLKLSEREMRKIRGRRIAMVFQEPMTSLNPVYTVGEQVAEAIELHRPVRRKPALEMAAGLLNRVGIASGHSRMHDYPHQFSGGMLQRAMIAMALACEPELLIADEPTTALDATTQLQILDLLRSIQAQTGMSILLITHDFGVVAYMADYVYVMYAGRIVEHAPAGELLSDPLHPYTQGLLACTPRLEPQDGPLPVIPGAPPEPGHFPPGCRFHPRCRLSSDLAQRHLPESVVESVAGPRVLRRCVSGEGNDACPPLRPARPGRSVACWEA